MSGKYSQVNTVVRLSARIMLSGECLRLTRVAKSGRVISFTNNLCKLCLAFCYGRQHTDPN